MTSLSSDALKRLIANATPGEWKMERAEDGDFSESPAENMTPTRIGRWDVSPDYNLPHEAIEADATLMLNGRELAEEVLGLRTQLTELKAKVGRAVRVLSPRHARMVGRPLWWATRLGDQKKPTPEKWSRGGGI